MIGSHAEVYKQTLEAEKGQEISPLLESPEEWNTADT